MIALIRRWRNNRRLQAKRKATTKAARVLSSSRPMFTRKVIAKANAMRAEMGMPLIGDGIS